MRRHRFHRPSFLVNVLVILLVVATGFALLHWHKDWSDQGCQLCHVRPLAIVYTPIEIVHAGLDTSRQEWTSELSAKELDNCIRFVSSRAPPAAALLHTV
jgi:hypothetical protein